MLKTLYFPGFLRILNMSLIKADGTWCIFTCKFQFFPLLWRLLPNCWKSRSFHPFNGFLCHFLVLTLRWGAPSGTTAEKVAISMLFPLQESLIFMISLRQGDQTQFLSSIAKVSCGIWACHYIQTDGIWLIFSAIFKVFLCVGRLLLKCWKVAISMLFPLQQSITLWSQFLSSIAKVSCGIWAWHYIQTDGIWLIFSAIFKVFLCVGRLLPNCWKSCSFHPFNGFLCRFLIFPLLWDAPSGKTSQKVAISMLFPLQQSLIFTILSKGTKPSFFRPLPRFPAEFEHVTTYKQMAHGLFSLQFSRFSFALGGFCQTADKVAVSILSMGFFVAF